MQLHDDWDAFFNHWQALPGPKRLVGYSVYGDQYYGAPGTTLPWSAGSIVAALAALYICPDSAM